MKLAALRKPITADAIDQYKEERAGLELDLLDEVLTSRRRGWQVATAGIGFGVLALALAGFVIWRYSQPIPEHMLVQDPVTGAVQQVSLIPGEQTSYGEATDAYWVAQFVIHHESYNFYAAQADYDFIRLTAAGDVATTYSKLWTGPNALDKVLGDSQATTTHVESVILDREHGLATVRYTRTTKYKDRPEADPPVHWIATVSYKYASKLMTAQQRYINPLGFQVPAFRPNTEAVGN
ncbi:MAG: type IV secretion system protein [Burkholderia sp.]